MEHTVRPSFYPYMVRTKQHFGTWLNWKIIFLTFFILTSGRTLHTKTHQLYVNRDRRKGTKGKNFTKSTKASMWGKNRGERSYIWSQTSISIQQSTPGKALKALAIRYQGQLDAARGAEVSGMRTEEGGWRERGRHWWRGELEGGRAWFRGCSWWRSWSPCGAPSRQTPSATEATADF